MDIDQLTALQQRIQSATGPDRRIDEDLYCGFGFAKVLEDGSEVAYCAPMYTLSLVDVTAFVGKVLPGWWISGGLCTLTGHASIGPDYNGPDCERLMAEWPPDIHDRGDYNSDLKPGDGWHRVCYAMLDCMLQALIAKAAGIPVREA